MRRAAVVAALLLTMTSAYAGELDFATHLYDDLAAKPGNLFFSPASIRLCLGLGYAGAHGDTAEQMRKTLGFADVKTEGEHVRKQLAAWDKLATPDIPQAQGSDPSMQRYWEEELKRRTTELHIANRLYAQAGHPLRSDYLARLKQHWRADAMSIDFAKAAEAARTAINAWVSERTKKKIPELIPAGMITSGTRAVLVNAIYFKASWAEVFTPEATSRQPFWLTSAQSVQAPLMQKVEHFGYAKVDGAQLVELPYGDEKLAMTIVLPDDRAGLAAVEKKLPTKLGEWISAIQTVNTRVFLPRFHIRGQFLLVDALKRLGLELPFAFPGADFSGIDGSKLLYFTNVVHEAVVDVDEKGTEAAAATAVSMKAGGMPQEPKTFRADHPFAFLIRDRDSGAVLFMGRVADPTK